MAHEPYIRDVRESRTAVLLIHGIVGTPDHFRDLMPLIPEDWTVHNLLLEGHGKEIGDFSKSSMKKWKAQVGAHLDQLRAEHDRVLIAAHSMGTLLAIDQSTRDPSGIAQLFLLNVPLRVHMPLSTVWLSVKAAFGLGKNDAAVRRMLADCSVRLSPRLWKYLGWIPRYIELLCEIRLARGLLADLRVPCIAFQSCRDELVSRRSEKVLAQHNHIQTVLLPDSGHFGYEGDDLQTICAAFSQIVAKLKTQEQRGNK